MRILFHSLYGNGVWTVPILAKSGHEIDLFIGKASKRDLLKGIVPPPLEEFPDPEPYDLVVFDYSDKGALADKSREVTPTIGSSKFAEKLENDRLFGIEFMEQCGINVPAYESFDDVGKAISWLKEHKLRTVFKPSGGPDDKSSTYVSNSVEDMLEYIEPLVSTLTDKKFILQEFVEGMEISTEGYFNGGDFCAVNHTLEEKKFMSGGIGPNTGCAGNLVWMAPGTKVFREGLAKSAANLRTHGFTGPIDLNVIVTKDKLYGLEWCPRFGYEGTCNLMQLLPMEFGEFLYTIASGESVELGDPKASFASSVRITVEPYPNPSNPEKYAGLPIRGIKPEDIDAFYLCDVMLDDDYDLVSAGTDGVIGAPLGTGDSITAAFQVVQSKIDKLQIPDLQYRDDIEECCQRRYDELEKAGWLDDAD